MSDTRAESRRSPRGYGADRLTGPARFRAGIVLQRVSGRPRLPCGAVHHLLNLPLVQRLRRSPRDRVLVLNAIGVTARRRRTTTPATAPRPGC